jgi:hypothetical protein
MSDMLETSEGLIKGKEVGEGVGMGYLIDMGYSPCPFIGDDCNVRG